MTMAEYQRQGSAGPVRVGSGHETDEIEVVVEAHERYVIVDKRDAYEPLVK